MIWNSAISQQLAYLRGINVTASSLSLLGSLIMAIFCLKSPNSQTISLRLILAMAISDFLYSVANLMSEFQVEDYNRDDPVDLFCQAEAFLRTFSVVSTIYWATCTAILCSKTLVQGKKFNQVIFFKRAVFIGIFIALTLDFLPLFIPHVEYARRPLFCWIAASSSSPNIWIRLLVSMLERGFPMIIGCLVSLIMYIKAIKSVRELPKEVLEAIDVRAYKLLWYPAALFMIFLPSLIDNIRTIFTGGESPFWVQAAHEGVTHSIGLVNAILYGIQRNLYDGHSDESHDESLERSQRGSILEIPLSNSMIETNSNSVVDSRHKGIN